MDIDVDFSQQPSGGLTCDELSQSPRSIVCDFFLDSSITNACQHDPHDFFNLFPEQQDFAVKLEDIAQSHPWESFSSTSEPIVGSETSEPPASTSARRPSSPSVGNWHRRSRERAHLDSPKGSTEINREKNRIAASKCRRKRKNVERVLEERGRILHAQNAMLKASAASLQAEILSLKHEILRHGTCNSQPINSYIATAANKLG